jgi:hypothetical protein
MSVPTYDHFIEPVMRYLAKHPDGAPDENKVCEQIVDRFGLPDGYICWLVGGLISADFPTPDYDIAFSQSAGWYKHRRKAGYYTDFSLPSHHKNDHVVFFVGKDYVSLFCDLMKVVRLSKAGGLCANALLKAS